MNSSQPHARSSQPAALVGWMEALSDPTRLRLLRLLEGHDLGVVELCDVLQMPQSTVSRHLKTLSDGQWLKSRRQGTTNLYRMQGDELSAVPKKLWLLAREQTDHWPTVRQDELRLDHRLRQRQTDTQAFFASAAGQWDKLRHELYGQRFTNEAMLALLPAEATVADLGCGTGQLVAALAGRVKQVIGVDNSAAMLKAAQKRLSLDQRRHDSEDGAAKNGANGVALHSSVDLRRGDLEAIPIDDASCDAALLLLVLTYVEDPAAVLAEARRILKPGGKLVIADLLLHDRDDFRREMEQRWPGFDPAGMRQMLEQAGFGRVHVQVLPIEPSAKGPAVFVASGQRIEAAGIMATTLHLGEDAHLATIKSVLDEYKSLHPRAKCALYRHTSASIRIRIIDPRFAKISKPERHDEVFDFIADRVDDDTLQEVSILLLLAPRETSSSIMNEEFEHPEPVKF